MGEEADLGALAIGLGGRRIADPLDRLRRYCGLPWSGGTSETWPYRYYDAIESPDADRITPIDVLAAGAIHPGLSRGDLAFFHDEADALAAWLASTPADIRLADADDDLLDHLAEVATWDVPVSLALLTKVLQRVRPLLVPIADQHLVDWYRRYTGEGDPVAAWPILLSGLRNDLHYRTTWLVLAMFGARLETELGRAPSTLRRVDILIRMDGVS